MLIVSNFLLGKSGLTFPDHTVIRVNVAWVKTKNELTKILKTTEHDIYLDYPDGRIKPPQPKLTLDQAIEFTHKFPRVKFFAVSNTEDPERALMIKKKLPRGTQLVPKIETKKGIENLEQIASKIHPSYIMLDKEDLYLNINSDSESLIRLIDLTRKKCQKLNIKVLELHGVVFLPYE